MSIIRYRYKTNKRNCNVARLHKKTETKPFFLRKTSTIGLFTIIIKVILKISHYFLF